MSKKTSTQEETLPATQAETLQSRAVAIKEQADLMAETMSDLGVSASDLIIPRLMLMQNTSEFVGNEKAKLGDIVNSQTMEVIGGVTSPVEIIPLKFFKTLRIYALGGSTPKFIRQEAVNPQNEKLPFEGNEQGVPVKRYLNFNFFVLLKKELDAGEAFPAVVSFKSSSMPAGKQIATQLFKMAALGKLPYSQSLFLTVSKEKKDTNQYAVFGTAKGHQVTETERKEAEKWLAVLSSVTYRVDEKEETPDVVRTPSGPTSVPPNDLY